MKKLIIQTLIASGVAVSALSPVLSTVYAEEKGKEPMKAVGQYVDDATITSKVKAKHAEDKAVSALRVNVETKQGVVVLSGVARTEAEAQRAEALAKQVEGVKAVSNMIELKPKS
jgi:hyperosmotically inducible periplasmic protein